MSAPDAVAVIFIIYWGAVMLVPLFKTQEQIK
jgi:hypothetical protein